MAATLFGLPENPFKITPNPRFAYRQGHFEQVLHEVRESVLGARSLVVVSARPGMGKTLLLLLLAEDLRRRVGRERVILRTCGSGCIADALPPRAEIDRQAPAVLLLDEAEALPPETLHGLLDDRPPGELSAPLRIVLAGGTELDALVARDGAPALYGHPVLHRRLDPLPAIEIERFVAARLEALGLERRDLFTDAALAAIGCYSSGVPRLVNKLCATALFLAETEADRRVSAELVRQAARSHGLLPPDPAPMQAPAAASPASPPDPGQDAGQDTVAGDRRAGLHRWTAAWRRRPALCAAAAGVLALALLGLARAPAGDGAAIDAPPAPVTALVLTDPASADPPRARPRHHPALLDGRSGGAPSKAVADRIAALAARARAQTEALKLTTPAGDNALESYRAILALVPGDAAALRGIHGLGGTYAELAERARRDGRPAAARLYYERGLSVAPRHPALLALAETHAAYRGAARLQLGRAPDGAGDGSPPAPWERRGRRR